MMKRQKKEKKKNLPGFFLFSGWQSGCFVKLEKSHSEFLDPIQQQSKQGTINLWFGFI